MEEIMMEQVVNLEHKIAEISYKIASQKIIGQNIVDKALGILVNDGVYAMFLFIEEKGRKEATSSDNSQAESDKDKNKNKTKPKEFCEKIERLLNEVRLINSCNCSTFEGRKECFKQLTEDLNKLLLARQILEKLLIYVRHQYKALGED